MPTECVELRNGCLTLQRRDCLEIAQTTEPRERAI